MQQVVPYRGEAPYIFISYAHRDSESVLPILARMQAAGFRIWFDEGIDPGTEWDNVIAAQIERCGYFLAFVSKNYLASENCKDELNFARDLDKHRLLVYLEEVALPGGMAMRMNRIQSVFKYKYAVAESFYEVLFSADGIYGMCDKEPPKKQGVYSSASYRPMQDPMGGEAVGTPVGKSFAAPSANITAEISAAKVVKSAFEHVRNAFVKKPTKLQLLKRLSLACVYLAFLSAGAGATGMSEFFFLAIVPLVICTLFVSAKEKKKALQDGAVPQKLPCRKGFLVAERILIAAALVYLTTIPTAFLLCFIWALFCFFCAFVPKGCSKISVGPFKLPKAVFLIASIVISFLAVGTVL